VPRLPGAALKAGADAVLCASIFHYGRYTVPQVREALVSAGVPVRPFEPAAR
jgi:cyclase